MYDLSFLPVAPEEYDFLVVENWRDRPGVRAFLAALARRNDEGAHPGTRHATGRIAA